LFNNWTGRGWNGSGTDTNTPISGLAGGEIIFSLDGPGGAGTFAHETSGTVNILGTLRWVQAHGYVKTSPSARSTSAGNCARPAGLPRRSP
jgi:hypothetical protein